MRKVRISTKRECLNKYQREIMEQKNTMTKLNKSVEGFNSRLDEAE